MQPRRLPRSGRRSRLAIRVRLESPVFARSWQSWLRLGRWLGDQVARIALTVSYFTVALPFGLLVSLTQDPLDLRSRRANWRERRPDEPSLERARRLFKVNMLGVSCDYHDAAAALVQDGLLVAAAEEERFTRRKHDASFPNRAIQFCLRQAGLRGPDLDYVVFHEKPLAKFDRILMTSLGRYPATWAVFRGAMIAWFQEKPWIRGQLVRALEVPADRVLFIEHHASHAASALFCSPFEEAALLTVDGVGEWTTAAMGRGRADWHGGDSSNGREERRLMQK